MSSTIDDLIKSLKVMLDEFPYLKDEQKVELLDIAKERLTYRMNHYGTIPMSYVYMDQMLLGLFGIVGLNYVDVLSKKK